MQEIYLDNAATTKVLESSAKIAYDIMLNYYGNPSSVHSFGFQSEKILKQARHDVMSAVGVNEKTHNLIFTSSGTEADNLAVIGTAKVLTKKGNRILMGNSEHPGVYNCRTEIENLGYEVLTIPNTDGKIDFDFVSKNLNDKTVLITHMYINNETGAIYDIKKLCSMRDAIAPKCLIHTDAVQAFLKTEKNLASSNADLISVSAHKIHAPKGVGALIYKKNIRISPLICGGGQEFGLRSGTESLPSICAFANSANILSERARSNLVYVSKLYSHTCDLLKNTVPSVIINTPYLHTPYILSITLPNIKSEVMLRFLSDKGIFVSAGSACSSKHKENRVLKNFGISDIKADCTLRISFSEFNTESDIEFLINEIKLGCETLARIK